MRELPTGTVTFLFTDVEGSTRLLQELGDAYAAVQDEHDAIVSRAVEADGGVVVRTEGDSFFVVYPSPAKALEAAVAAQRGLAGHRWSHGAPLRVRMGMHSGEGVLGGGDYVGIDVNRAARIAAAGHGGQILLSEATRGLVKHALPGGVSLRDLGEHRLKDIAHPERLYDVAIDGLQTDFPPLRTLDARPNNLPVQLTSFVGRELEIAETARLLGRARLVTLTGPGGSGKTRLALQIAAETISDFEDGAFLADLSAVTDPAVVVSAVAGALGVAEEPGRSLIEGLKEHLRGRDLLLILDNFEQVVEAAPIVEDMLMAAPGLRVIVTSRTPLGVRGEHERLVPPFEPPDPERVPDLPTFCETEAVRLFTERALAVNPRFEVTEGNAEEVAEVLVRLDGLPLAIELAATRTKLLAPEQMVERLDHRLSLLESGPRTLPERQRTLRGAIAWSYDLLEESERTMFARLSIFAGGWTLASAEAVCDTLGLGLDPLDAMTSLVDKSLVRLGEGSGGDPRFSMLETIREFGREQLEALGEFDDVRRRHAEHFLDLALEVEPHLMDEDQSGWLDRCEREHANIRGALRWAIEAGEIHRAQEAAGALWRFWHLRGHLAEGRRWFEELLAHPEGQERTAARAKALTGAGGIAWWQADVPAARGFYEESLAIERGQGNPARVAAAAYDMAHAAIAGEESEDALRLLEEALGLFREVGDELGATRTLSALAMADAIVGNWEASVRRQEEGVEAYRRLGDPFHLANGLSNLGVGYGRVGRWDESRTAIHEALELFSAAQNPTGIASVILDLSFVLSWQGRHEDAVRLAGAWEVARDAAGGGPPSDFLGTLIGDPVQEAKDALPEEVARRAWDEGKALSWDEAVSLARELTE